MRLDWMPEPGGGVEAGYLPNSHQGMEVVSAVVGVAMD